MTPFFQMTLVPQISHTEWYRGRGGPSDGASSSAGRGETEIEPALFHHPTATASGMGPMALAVPPRTREEAVLGTVVFGQRLQSLPGPLQLPCGQQPAR